MLLALSLLAALGTAPAAPAADSLTGTWKITGDAGGNPVVEVCTITQTGATLAGTCVGQAGEKLALTGEIKDGKLVLRHPADYQGQALTLTYTATVFTAKELKGTMDVQPFGLSGPFTAVPEPAKP